MSPRITIQRRADVIVTRGDDGNVIVTVSLPAYLDNFGSTLYVIKDDKHVSPRKPDWPDWPEDVAALISDYEAAVANVPAHEITVPLA